MEINQLIPYTGTFTAENSSEVKSGSGNFMWHAMTAYQWFHQSLQDIDKTIKELQDIQSKKVNILDWIRKAIYEFDWSHMYSDDSRPSREQDKRNKGFNEVIAKCPKDIQLSAYHMFVKAYIDCSPHSTAPISFDQFKEGIKV